MHGAASSDARDARAQHLDPLADQAPVGFELGFAGTAQPDAALLPLQVGPVPGQPGREVRQLCELHLQLAFGVPARCAKMSRMRLFAVDHAAIEPSLEVALLYAREHVVEDDEIGAGFMKALGDLVDLPASGEERGSGAPGDR